METIKKWLLGLLVGPQVGVWVRALLKIAAGYLVARGLMEPAAQETWINLNTDVITAIIFFLIAQAGSLVAATAQKQALQETK